MVRLCPSSQVICLPAPCIAIALLVVCRRRRPSECHASYRVSIGGRFCPQNWLPWQHPLMDRKNDLRLFIYGQSFASPANFVKIGVVDDELIGLTEITKDIFLKKHKQNISPPHLHFVQSRWGVSTTCKSGHADVWLPPKVPLPMGRSGPPPYRWFVRLSQVHFLNGSIGSAIFVGLTVVTNSLFLQLVACRLEEYYFGVFLQE